MENEYLKIGQVIEVRGQKIKVKVFKNKNSSIILHNGQIIKNITVGSLIKIAKGYNCIVGKVEGEYIQELKKDVKSSERFDKNGDSIERIIDVSIMGVIEEKKFVRGIVDIPLVFSDVYVLDETELKMVFKFYHNIEDSIPVGDISGYIDHKLNIDIQSLFASHIGIFGNTGSGKSNTLAKIYTELFFKCSKFPNFSRSQFVVIDFNGEYNKAFTNDSHKKSVYNLSTRTEKGDKLPINSTMLQELDFWAIVCEATDKTQRPFLDSVIKWYKDIIAVETEFVDKIKKYVTFILYAYFGSPESLSQKQTQFLSTLKIVLHNIGEISVLFNKIGVIPSKGKNNSALYFQEPGSKDYINSKEDFKTKLLSPVLNCITPQNVKPIDEYALFEFSLKLKYLNDLAKQFINDEHIAPLIKRFENRNSGLKKIFTTDKKAESKQIEIISLVDVNLAFKKIIPMLICKNKYDIQKSCEKKDGIPNGSLHIVIDEAHNILSSESERESQTWKDYRLETFEEIIKEGRKFGVFLTIASQRPSDISETIVSQLHNYFIHRLVNNEDIRLIGRAVAFIDSASFEMIPILQQGGCIFTGVASNFPVVVQVDILNENLRPNSNTIDLLNLWDGEE